MITGQASSRRTLDRGTNREGQRVHDRSKRLFSPGWLAALVGLVWDTSCLASARDLQVRVTPLSAELGLFDIAVTGQGPEPVWIEILDASLEVRMRVPLRRAEGVPTWRGEVGVHDSEPVRARLMLDEGTRGAARDRLLLRIDGQEPVSLDKQLDPARSAPDWALGATWYQIFPERYRNGDRNNDPAGPQAVTVAWTSDFSDVTPEEIEIAWSRLRADDRRTSAGWNRPGGARRATIYARRYGGDLQGVHQTLAHIQSLGITAIYFCPVFASSSLHKYDARDFRHIDPTFGPVPARPEPDGTWDFTDADRYFLDTLLPEAKRRGIRVILDGVWNHTGTDFWAFKDVMERGAESRYANWFRARFNADGQLAGWDAWDSRNGNLPEFVQTPGGDLTPEVSDHIFRVTSRWMDPNGDGDPSDGIDGWRLDVAPEIGNAFWTRWRAHVRSINPDAVLIGEIWFDAEPWFNGVAFDAQMNYPFASAIVEWASGSARASSQSLTERLLRVFSHAPHTELCQMNLLGSHDTTRLLTMLSRPLAAYDDGATMADVGRDAARVRPSQEVSRRAVLAVALQATLPGSPMIFAGDEFGVFGPDDPDNRKPIQWPDQDPPLNPDDAPDLWMLDQFRAWLTLRHDPAVGATLRYGTVRFLESGNADVLAFERELNGKGVVIVVNRSHSTFDAADLVGSFMNDSPDARVPGLSARIFHASLPGDPRR